MSFKHNNKSEDMLIYYLLYYIEKKYSLRTFSLFSVDLTHTML